MGQNAKTKPGPQIGEGTQQVPTQAPSYFTPYSFLTPLSLPGLGLPEAPLASTSLLLLPLPLQVTAFFRHSTERGGS